VAAYWPQLADGGAVIGKLRPISLKNSIVFDFDLWIRKLGGVLIATAPASCRFFFVRTCCSWR
jgi:hypothetical protein